MLNIKVKNITSMALSEDAGKLLREKINSAFEANENMIQIDFNEINIFTTMFFNASLGYFILNHGPDIMDKIELINLSDLGRETFNHSKANAEIIYKKRQEEQEEEVVNITQKNIEEL